jgi:thymidylate synthase
VAGELLGFFRGYTSAAQFRALGCRVWDANANENAQWLANPQRAGTDDLGRIYGVQWTRWRDVRYAHDAARASALHAQGYALKAHDQPRAVWVFEREVNQLEDALRTLLRDPTNRRVVVSAWRPDEFDQMALPPCHVQYMFCALPDGALHATLWQRSLDLFLGAPFNIASLALFTHVMARYAGMRAASATLFASDAHVYESHIAAVREQLERSRRPSPSL